MLLDIDLKIQKKYIGKYSNRTRYLQKIRKKYKKDTIFNKKHHFLNKKYQKGRPEAAPTTKMSAGLRPPDIWVLLLGVFS